MVVKNLHVLVLWMKLASALEALKVSIPTYLIRKSGDCALGETGVHGLNPYLPHWEEW